VAGVCSTLHNLILSPMLSQKLSDW
jgi:hypothetical protein